MEHSVMRQIYDTPGTYIFLSSEFCHRFPPAEVNVSATIKPYNVTLGTFFTVLIPGPPGDSV